ncbi:MAG: autoinducer 2 import system permease LsrD [Alphaproteobacteria bacterium]|nr:autoinducer 2 import system permease LsrD [Alphaproteobacteria bacterium]MBU1551522.1 autoinducer 2 import system permease LsrD [Alphaproteobacteria bacterium]MBU2337257.1 autoinducer 2 import system permease LsrD [Alphaproteobacteria bacterium]MBU2388000.1 autoinducer 2 import system permease LsrD [Alphaproteobacteria bacterium]
MNKLIFRWETALLLMLVGELVIFGLLNPRFLNVSNLIYGTSDFVQIGIVALPLTLVIIAGGIDVSFASVIGLAAIVFGVATFYGVPLPLSITLALVAGAVCGLFNATMIRLSKIQPLVVTLGSLYLFQGTATVASGLVGAGGYEGIGNFPAVFNAFGYAEVMGLPAPLALFLVLALVLIILLHFTRFGRTVFLSGQSESAARFAGIPVGRVQTTTYVITGVSAAIAGLVMSAYFGSARVDLGSATLLPAVTAAVLGGASIYGGQGSILGTLIATFVIGYLQQGLQATGVPSQISSALSGGLLVVAVALRHGSAMLAEFIAVTRLKKETRVTVTSGGERE